MITDELQGEPKSGSVPHAYRNALFWNWVRAMPAHTPNGFVALLYALGAAADPSGLLRFRDGKPITIKQIAGSVRGEVKQVRVWVDAAIAAGVLTYSGSRKQGATAMYALVLSPMPDWGAAQSAIKAAAELEKAKQEARKNKKPPPWQAEERAQWDEEFGGPPPFFLEDREKGGPPPELPPPEPDEERGAVPLSRKGDRPLGRKGGGPPNNPGVPKRASHDGAEVGGQPQVALASPTEGEPGQPPAEPPEPVQAAFLIGIAGGAELPEPDTPPAAEWTRCTACHGRLITRPGRTTHHAHCTPDERNTG